MRTILVAMSLGALAVPQTQRPVIPRVVTYVSTDLVVTNDRGQFVADLGEDDFEVYEDDVKQQVVAFVRTHDGRVLRESTADSGNDAAGRIFMIFVDDLHMNFRDTGHIRDLFKKIRQDLIHDGDLVGMVSSGPSAIAIDMTYHIKQIDEGIREISGAGLKPDELISTPWGAQGLPEVRYRAHVAFSAVYKALQKLEQVHNRRKALIYVSNGYDFDPFSKFRAADATERFGPARDSGEVPGINPFSKTGNEFAADDLVAELAELTREANRANTTIYTLDQRSLAAAPDIARKNISDSDWQDYLHETENSLRVIAERTGGIPVVGANHFTAALERIDNDTRDYYVLGYYSTNGDPSKKRRTIEVRVQSAKQTGSYELSYKTSYTLKPAKS